jgi:hypothetical protein
MVGLEEEAAAAMAAPAVDEVCWPWPSAITALPGDGNISLSASLSTLFLSLALLSQVGAKCMRAGIDRGRPVCDILLGTKLFGESGGASSVESKE